MRKEYQANISTDKEIQEAIEYICDCCENHKIHPIILSYACCEILKRDIFSLDVYFHLLKEEMVNDVIEHKSYLIKKEVKKEVKK